VDIELATRDEGVSMRIRDDGVGFDPDAPVDESMPGHAGVPFMRERARQAGGWCRIRSAPGDGTTVECWIPARVGERGSDDPAM
jgi:signal transduction histidine kinase